MIRILFFVLTIASFTSYGQVYFSQNVSHTTDYTPDNTDGCTYVQFIVYFDNGNGSQGVSSTSVQLDDGNNTTLNVTVPGRNPTILSKVVRFLTDVDQYSYDIQGSSNYIEYDNWTCYCDDNVRSRIITINETTSSIEFSYSHVLCCPTCDY